MYLVISLFLQFIQIEGMFRILNQQITPLGLESSSAFKPHNGRLFLRTPP